MKKEHGFMKRMKTRAGRNVLKARRAKGRKRLAAEFKFGRRVLLNIRCCNLAILAKLPF